MRKYLLLPILLLFTKNAFGMEIESHHKKNVLHTISQDVRKDYNLIDVQPSDIKPNTQQWWYLDQMIEHKGFVQTVCFNPIHNRTLMTTSCDKYDENYTATSFNLTSNQIVAEFPCDESHGKSICYNPSKTLTAMSIDGRGCIAHITNNSTTVSLQHPAQIRDICFDSTGELFATASGKTARIFKQYEDYTLDQLQLKQAMNTWLALRKPVLVIEKEKVLLKDILPALLKEIADKKIFVPYLEQLTIEDELLNIWNTFPTNMQFAILRTIKHKIERYGHIKTLPRKPFSHSYNKQDIETVKPIVESLTEEKHAIFQSYANLLNTHRQNCNLDGMVVYAPNKK